MLMSRLTFLPVALAAEELDAAAEELEAFEDDDAAVDDDAAAEDELVAVLPQPASRASSITTARTAEIIFLLAIFHILLSKYSFRDRSPGTRVRNKTKKQVGVQRNSQKRKPETVPSADSERAM